MASTTGIGSYLSITSCAHQLLTSVRRYSRIWTREDIEGGTEQEERKTPLDQASPVFVGGLGLSWQFSFGILVLLYFYSHYFFASGAAHIGAMFTAFLSVSSALGTPPLFGAMVLAFLSNLMGGLSHYEIGSAPVFYDQLMFCSVFSFW